MKDHGNKITAAEPLQRKHWSKAIACGYDFIRAEIS
jgi:hypothetical protein